jgi:dienelactone hydrolase
MQAPEHASSAAKEFQPSATSTLLAARVVVMTVLLALALTACAALVRFPGPTTEPKQLTGHLVRPRGAGPFPAAVLLHNCAGILMESDWARWLAAEGYVALIVDSFNGRGTTNVCSPGSPGPSTSLMAMDALAALDHLQTLDFVKHDRIAVIGWSYGGTATLAVTAYQEDRLLGQRTAARRFRAAVVFYPWCGALSRVTMPTLLLLGEVDEELPPAACVVRGEDLRRTGAPIDWLVFPGAHHNFDNAALGTQAHKYRGFTVKYDADATSKAQKRIREFLGAQLK